MDNNQAANDNQDQSSAESDQIFLALAGNPNSGKTTIFNAITGARQHVGNYPGVTVERREGKAVHKGRALRVIDLPGTYSLTAHSPDEVVAREVLLEENPDAVIHVVDAGNLERNLYLTVQMLEMRAPLVIALNMMDEVAKKGVKIDVDQLSALLGAPIVPTVGYRGEGISELLSKAAEVARSDWDPKVQVRFGPELDKSVDAIQDALQKSDADISRDRRWLAIKLLEADAQVEEWVRKAGASEALARAREEQSRILSMMGDDPEILMADARYGWVHGAVAETVSLAVEDRRSLTDQVDTILANRVLGLPIFLFFMWLTFAATFVLGKPLMGLIEKGTELAGLAAAAAIPDTYVNLESLVADGIIGGVGGVLVFLPNIMILFMMVSIMEDSGYMARAAFIVDKVMHMVGLHGKSFIPMFVGFGCNVPGIMAARVLENERDRITTILVCPFVSCSARLPVYVLLAGTFFPKNAGTVVFSLYVLGIVVAMVMARLLRTYIVKGPPTPFVMELPPYRMPTAKSVIIHMWERAWMYIKKAGTIILAFSIVVWFLSSYPARVEPGPQLAAEIEAAKISIAAENGIDPAGVSDEMLPPALKNKIETERLKNSYAGRYGSFFAPALKPIGLGDWKVAVALSTGVAAKEIVVSTMGTLYSLGNVEAPESSVAGAALGPETATPDEAADEQGGLENYSRLSRAIHADGFFTPLKAYALMVFVLLYIPCLATLTVAYRELGSWKWTAVMFFMTTSVAYFLAGVVYWGGTLLGLGG